MTDTTEAPGSKRSLWMRFFYMVLMVLAFHVSWTVLIAIAVIQLILAVVSGGPNGRLAAFGCSLGGYLGQIACFLTFATEEIPFPFSDWPSGERGAPG